MVSTRDVLVEFAVHIYFAGAHDTRHHAFFANKQIICGQVASDIAVDYSLAWGRNGSFEGHACANDQIVCYDDVICHVRIL